MAIPKYRSGQLVLVRPTDKDPGGYGRITKVMWSEEDGYQEEGVRVLIERDHPKQAAAIKRAEKANKNFKGFWYSVNLIGDPAA